MKTDENLNALFDLVPVSYWEEIGLTATYNEVTGHVEVDPMITDLWETTQGNRVVFKDDILWVQKALASIFRANIDNWSKLWSATTKEIDILADYGETSEKTIIGNGNVNKTLNRTTTDNDIETTSDTTERSGTDNQFVSAYDSADASANTERQTTEGSDQFTGNKTFVKNGSVVDNDSTITSDNSKETYTREGYNKSPLENLKKAFEIFKRGFYEDIADTLVNSITLNMWEKNTFDDLWGEIEVW